MKKLCLLIALVASPVFAQEEEQEVQIEIETGGGVEVAASAGGEGGFRTIAAYPDKSVWFFDSGGTGNDDVFYCYINEDGNPRCEEVDIDD